MGQESDQAIEISLSDILSSLRNHIVLIILITIITAGGFFGINKYVITPTYDSTVKFYIEASRIDEDNPSAGLQAVNLAQRISNTYIELMKTNSFFNLLQTEIDANLSISELERSISYKSLQETEIIEANVRTDSPELSLEIAKTISQIAPEAMNEIKSNATLKVIDQPLLAVDQSTPHTMRNTVLGSVLGLFIGFVLAILIDMSNIKIKTEEDITRNFDINVIGVVPKVK
ncbi:MAG: hypothetical protein GX217_08845 [Clostridiaceae bacterium]|mgnify:CR=1 FL=1|nr:hypothetical protein [Clostridiaceae bacterium]